MNASTHFPVLPDLPSPPMDPSPTKRRQKKIFFKKNSIYAPLLKRPFVSSVVGVVLAYMEY